MTSVAKDHILIRHQPFNKFSLKTTILQIIGSIYFLIYSLIYLNIIMFNYWLLYNYLSIIMFLFTLLIIGYCRIIHPMICNIVILSEKLLNGWCRMRMRPARLVSYAFLYTTIMVQNFGANFVNGFVYCLPPIVFFKLLFPVTFSSFPEYSPSLLVNICFTQLRPRHGMSVF